MSISSGIPPCACELKINAPDGIPSVIYAQRGAGAHDSSSGSRTPPASSKRPPSSLMRFFQQVHGRAADKARHKAAGWLSYTSHRGADLLGNAFVHHHHPLGEGHRLHLVMWVTYSEVVFRRRCSCCSSRRICTRSLASRFDNGSSKREYRRITHDGAAHRHALALAAGQFPRAALDRPSSSKNAPPPAPARRSIPYPCRGIFSPPRHVLFHAHMRIKGIVLEHHLRCRDPSAPISVTRFYDRSRYRRWSPVQVPRPSAAALISPQPDGPTMTINSPSATSSVSG